MKDGGKDVADKVAQALLKGFASDKPSPSAFFEPLQAGLSQASASTIGLLRKKFDALRDSDQPDVVGAAIVAASEEAALVAYAAQYARTLDGWATYIARADQGTTYEGGTDLADDLEDGADAGLLSIHVQLGTPGATHRILDAEIEGLSAPLERNLASRPVAQLDVPIVIEGELPFPYTKYPNADVNAGRNEQGRVWAETDEIGSLLWLHHRAGGTVSEPVQKGEREVMEQTAEEGAKRLIERDLASMTLGKILE